MRRVARWLSPSGFLLAGFCFTLTFVMVSCDVPGGYGKTKPGGGAAYTGLDMALGGEPTVDDQFLLPPDQWREDRLPGQPLAFAALVLVLMGLVWTVWRRDPRIRRAGAAAVAGVAVLLLLANQARVEAFLADRVRDQIAVAAPDAPSQTSDHVQTGNGFGLCLLLLLLVGIGNAVAWWRVRRRQRAGLTSSPA